MNILKIGLLFFVCFFSTLTYSWWFDLISVQDLLQQNPTIVYQKCYDEIPFDYQQFPLSIDPKIHPNQGFFKETFILTIPKGIVQFYGLVLTPNNQFVEELIWKGFLTNLTHVQKFNQMIYLPYKVAVIGQIAGHNYWHWTTEILCRLALLELQGVQYDYLYVPYYLPYMQETLQLWGIDPNKIIVARNSLCIQAEQLIVPSLVSNISLGTVWFSCYAQPHLIKHVQEKLLTAALKKGPSKKLSKRVFVSRKDARQRQVINEDEVYSLLQAEGFERYTLEHLSVVDQILLFHNAEIIVSPQGTGLANSIFCTSKTKIIELFQGLNDCTFWYLAQTLNLNYTPIATTEFLTTDEHG